MNDFIRPLSTKRKVLRPYQFEAKASALASWAKGAKETLVSVATGGGKTLIACDVMTEFPNERILFLAPTRELVNQAVKAIDAHLGVRPGVEMARQRALATDRIVVGSVQTLCGRELPGAEPDLIIIDECFPAGTIISGHPIESLKIGDWVEAYNETSGNLEPREIVRLFKNPMPRHMVRLTNEHHVTYCTLNHPIFTKRGWVKARDLNDETDYVLSVRPTSGSAKKTSIGLQKKRSGVLFKKVFRSFHVKNFFGNHGKNQSQIRKQTNDLAQSDGSGRCEGVGQRNTQVNETQAAYAGRKWKTCNTGRTSSVLGIIRSWFCQSGYCKDWCHKEKQSPELPASLQTRLRKSGLENSDRSGWQKPQGTDATRTRPEERQILDWKRLGGIEVLEYSDFRSIPECYGDGFVYNFEVEGLHTYTANGVVVHNCHHRAAKNWVKLLARWPNAKKLDLTATPYRLDNKPLKAFIDGDEYNIGLLELIQQGYLADIKLLQCPVKVDMTGLNTRGGDFQDDEMAERVLPHIEKLADWVAAEHAWRRMITFTPNKQISRVWSEALCARGLAAAHIDGVGTERQRRPIYDAFASGAITHLSNAQLLLEGYDNPRADALLMLRLTQSRCVLAQAVGRISRLHPDKDFGIVLDPLFVASDQARATFGAAMLDDNPRNARITELTGAGLSLAEAAAMEEDEHQAEREARRAAGEPEEGEGETPVAPEAGDDDRQRAAQELLDSRLRETALLRDASETPEAISLAEYCAPKGVKRVTSMKVKAHTSAASGKNSLRVVFTLVNAPTETLYFGFDDPGYRGQLARDWWFEFGGRSPAPVSVNEAADRRDELRQPAFVEPVAVQSGARTFTEVRRRSVTQPMAAFPDINPDQGAATAFAVPGVNPFAPPPIDPFAPQSAALFDRLSPPVAARVKSISLMTADEAEAYTQKMLDDWEAEQHATAPAPSSQLSTVDRKSSHPWEYA